MSIRDALFSPPKTDEERRDPWLNLEIVNELGSSRAMAISYLHSFFMTDDYLIFTEQPWILGCSDQFVPYNIRLLNLLIINVGVL